jgi:hypothetical protein
MTIPELGDDTGETVLPTFAVLARFREPAQSAEGAVRAVERRLAAADEPFQEVTVEREEGPSTWMVVARFVMVSVDAHTAVVGLSEVLDEAGLAPDEVWADQQIA